MGMIMGWLDDWIKVGSRGLWSYIAHLAPFMFIECCQKIRLAGSRQCNRTKLSGGEGGNKF